MSYKTTLMIIILGLFFALAQTASQISIKRDDTDITITNFGKGSDGAKTVLNNKHCKDGFITNIIYAATGIVQTVTDKTTLKSQVVIIEKPRGEKKEEQETLELFGAKLEFNRPRCPEHVERSTDDGVHLEQGKTTIDGVNFFLDRESNIGRMKGPIRLERISEKQADKLSATADLLEVNMDTDAIDLKGNVLISSGGRESRADRLEYDDENAIAILYGNPAISSKDKDVLKAQTIIYYLDSNDVLAKGKISGEFQFDTGSERPRLGFSKPEQENP